MAELAWIGREGVCHGFRAGDKGAGVELGKGCAREAVPSYKCAKPSHQSTTNKKLHLLSGGPVTG